MPAENGKTDNLVQTVTEISDRMSNLVRDEIELAKAEVGQKAMSLLKGTVAVAAGAVFGVFAIVFGALAVLALLAFVIASRLLKRGAPPTPTMAIDEAKQIRATVAATSEAER